MDFTETFIVIVGPQGEKRYTLHKCMAVKTSEYFASATKGAWKEASDGVVKLSEVTPQLFDSYILWLYTREIPLRSVTGSAVTEEDGTDTELRYMELMGMYTLGYYLLDSSFRNAIVTAVIELRSQAHGFPGLGSIQALWPSTPDDCPMKRLIVQDWATCKVLTDEHWNNVPKYFLIRVIKEMTAIRDGKVKITEPTLANACEWHEHDEKVSKCR